MEEKKLGVAGFLYNKKLNSVLLHLPDGNTKLNPHKWAFFGGLGENEEIPSEAFMRELHEEINLEVDPKEVIPLRSYSFAKLFKYRAQHNATCIFYK